jgi:isoquinoline 1-oxidoreductase beta subunit
VRKGGATARGMLVQAAANEWQVPASECRAVKSVITHTPSSRTTTYGKVAAAAARLTPPAAVTLKDPKDWTLVGKRLARLDTVDKTTGALVYGMDLKMPGLLNAAIKDCPVFGGKVKSFDAAAIAQRPGIKKVVQVGSSAVAVIADTWWHAKSALDVLPIEWDNGPNAQVSSASIAQVLKAGLDAPDGIVGNSNGDARAAIASAARKIEAVYSYPFLNHATMEPMRSGRPRKTAKPRWRPPLKPPGCRSPSAMSTSCPWVAVLDGAGRPTMCVRPWPLPGKCLAYRSRCSGRAKRTCCMAATTPSPSAVSRPGWMRKAM